jgi:hypothetical protein
LKPKPLIYATIILIVFCGVMVYAITQNEYTPQSPIPRSFTFKNITYEVPIIDYAENYSLESNGANSTFYQTLPPVVDFSYLTGSNNQLNVEVK